MTTNCFYSQDIPEPLHTMVSKEPPQEPEGYPLEACRGIAVMLLGMVVFALACGLAWWIWGLR